MTVETTFVLRLDHVRKNHISCSLLLFRLREIQTRYSLHMQKKSDLSDCQNEAKEWNHCFGWLTYCGKNGDTHCLTYLCLLKKKTALQVLSFWSLVRCVRNETPGWTFSEWQELQERKACNSDAYLDLLLFGLYVHLAYLGRTRHLKSVLCPKCLWLALICSGSYL